MAKSKLARRTGGGSRYKTQLARAQSSAAAARRRAREIAGQREEVVLSVGAATLMGFARRQGWNLPTFGGVSPELLYGGLIGLVGPELTTGKTRTRMMAAGGGLLAVAAHQWAAQSALGAAPAAASGWEAAGWGVAPESEVIDL
jgi:hypothetical protein